MAVIGNRYYNDPNIGRAFAGLASAFAPPSVQDAAATTAADLNRQRYSQLAELFAATRDPSERSALVGIQNYGQTPGGFRLGLDNDFRMNESDNATLRSNNAADNDRAYALGRYEADRAFDSDVIGALTGPLSEGQMRPEMTPEFALALGLPAGLPAVQGNPKPLSLDEAKAQDYQGLPQDVREQALLSVLGPDAPKYSMVPTFGRDENGEMVMLQVGNNGTAAATRLPPGVTVDAGAAAFERARGNAVGKMAGEAQADMVGTLNAAKTAMALIDGIAADPALEGITGMIQGRLPPLTQAGTDLNAKLDQVKGKAFLEAFDMLRGAGQITEIEGQKATDAIARLSRAQSPEAYRASLADLRAILELGVSRAQARAAGGVSGLGGAPAAPGGQLFQVPPDMTPDQLMQLGLPSGTPILLPDGSQGVIP